MPHNLSAHTANIRLALPADAENVRLLRLEALAAHPAAFGADLEQNQKQSVEDWAERIAAYQREETGLILVAEVGSQLVGMCGLARGNSPKTRHTSFIWGVFLQADWRGQKLIDQLIAGCLHWAGLHAITVVNLGVSVSNIPAIRAYLRFGFSVYGVEPMALYVDGVYIDELLMTKRVISS